VFFHYKRLRPDSGGDGEFRGGLGQDVLMEITADPISAAIVAERTKFAAPGLGGGADGGLGDVQINGATVDNRQDYILRRGDRVLLRLPGGGGYGRPDSRPQARRDKDRIMGYTQL
jgi:N-methylhydantoinase B